MYNPEIIQLFNAALEGVIKACDIILYHYNAGFEVEYKNDNSPVTQADKNADEAIRAKLASTGLPIISEEHSIPAYQERKDYQRYWLVDPLDGTKDFVQKNGEFTINVALIEDGKAVAGLICVPVTKEIYFGGAHYPSIKYQGDLLALDMEQMILNAERLPNKNHKEPIIVASRSGDAQTIEKLAHQHLCKEKMTIQRVGSSLKFCWLAEGRADFYPRLTPAMEWDIAAGQAIAEGTGKTVLDYHTKTSLVYNKESLLSSWFIAK